MEKEQIHLHLKNLSYRISEMKKKKKYTSAWVFDEIDKFSDNIVNKWAETEDYLWKHSQADRIDKVGRWRPSTKSLI